MKDILADIHQYSHNLTISQVVSFFERRGITITRSMIQNYVRDGLLPPPLNKRHYTHKHLAVLALTATLKTVYEMPEIRTALAPLTDKEGIPIEKYKELLNKVEGLSISAETDALTIMAYSAGLKSEAIRRLKK